MKYFKKNLLLIYNNKIIMLFVLVYLLIPIFHYTFLIFNGWSNNVETLLGDQIDPNVASSAMVDLYDTLTMTDLVTNHASSYLLICIFIPFILMENTSEINYNFNNSISNLISKIIVITMFTTLIGILYYYVQRILILINIQVLNNVHDVSIKYDVFNYSDTIFLNILFTTLFCVSLYFLIIDQKYVFIYYFIILSVSVRFGILYTLLVLIIIKFVYEFTKVIRRRYDRVN